MRVFPLDPNPVTSAAWLDDYTAVNSIASLSWILADTYNFLCGEGSIEVPANRTKFNELSEAELNWLRSSLGNSDWILRYAVRVYRRCSPSVQNKYSTVFHTAAELLEANRNRFQIKGVTPFVNNAVNRYGDFRNEPNVHTAYKQLFQAMWRGREKQRPTWNLQGLQPHWFTA